MKGRPRSAAAARLSRRRSSVQFSICIGETTPDSMGVFLNVDRTAAAPRVWFVEQLGFFDVKLWLGDANGAKTRLDLPTDIWMEAHRDWLAVKRRAAHGVPSTPRAHRLASSARGAQPLN